MSEMNRRPWEEQQNVQAPQGNMPAPIDDSAMGRMPMQPDDLRARQFGQAMARKQLNEQGGMIMPDQEQGMPPEQGGVDAAPANIVNSLTQRAVGKEQIARAENLLKKYKAGKAHLERQIIESQQWWKLRNWDEERKERGVEPASASVESNTAWLHNCINAKHADIMNSYPEPMFLAREQSDEQEAQMLTSVVPVVLQINDFENTYSQVAYQKLLEGTGAYAVYWDQKAANGLGEISIRKVNVLNLFWEPGVENIQDSRNLFYVTLEDNDVLEQMYPELRGHTGSSLTVSKYLYDDHIDTSDKTLVVDWYYHRYDGERRTLQYCRFCNGVVLYASEDDPERGMDGWYADGRYPFVLDPLYPIEGTPAGYGFVRAFRDAQTDIDLLNHAVVLNTVMSSTPRYFSRTDGGINEEEFGDWSRPIVHCDGNLGSDSLAPISVPNIQSNAISMLQQKIEEMKFCTGNTDVNNGSTPSGVTAASAIAALQESSGRTSKDLNRSTYRAFREVVKLVLERIRQFYDLPRQFRITGEMGEQQFVSYDNSGIRLQDQGNDFGVDMGYRLPEFDINVTAERENAYTRTAQNELAIQLFQLGVFNPQQADMSLMLLDMMDFNGKQELQQKVQRNGGMQQQLMQVGQIALALASKYEPDTAAQLQQILQGMSAAPAAAVAGSKSSGASKQSGEVDHMSAQANQVGTSKQGAAMVQKARTNADESVRPE